MKTILSMNKIEEYMNDIYGAYRWEITNEQVINDKRLVILNEFSPAGNKDIYMLVEDEFDVKNIDGDILHSRECFITRGENLEESLKSITVRSRDGGRIRIIDYYPNKNEDGDTDIGSIHIMNGHGLGGSSYIRNRDEMLLDKHSDELRRVVWIDEISKTEISKFLNEMKEGDR